ncbi:hypothetical protein H2201_005675 [Coniosporium apollinis]|uniref:Haloacid dehalogenase-like hydrolase n=1 Tax=Coniosporium apollinis TaxID=61459 RepID=A0ABQ9NPF0_9PEZI|nr:hypothetical protein H2201_005675 [Coniosporium apollinis]
MSTPRPSLHFILDWDGTLTKRDTLAVLANIPAARRSAQQQDPWAPITSAYADDYAAHARSYRPETAARTTLAAEAAWLASLKEVEERSVRRVEEAGVFRGVTVRDVEDGAKEVMEKGDVELRRGWEGVFLLGGERGALVEGRAGAVGLDVSIVSVNWSATFIRACLLHAAARAEGRDAALRDKLREAVKQVRIIANEIEGLNDPEGSSGMLNKKDEDGIRTSSDKLRCMQQIRQGQEERLVVYVGDSPTDLECLTAADVGVCIRDDPMSSAQKELAKTLDRISDTCAELSAVRDVKTLDLKNNTLYWARDLEEVVEMIGRITTS